MSEIMITGSAGRLEGRYKHNKLPGAPVALILHPNPQKGGTMNNKVSYSLFQSFVEQGFSTLRFNFRGVGRSQGEFSYGEGELSDAASALDWLQGINPNSSSIWIGGFSFGAWIGMQLLMRRPEIHGYVSISPPANVYDFNFLAPCPNEGLIIQGDNDQIASIESVNRLVDKLKDQRGPNGVDYRVISGAGHFFNNEGETELMLKHVNEYLNCVMLARKAAA
ncbi:MAG: alpha/beta hydrolase [Alphaproteobacteria bacterium]|nr:alpha/beta hydrolase [Alphaproteobacteria bacterium]MCK5659613.1 alpha/beta hydrolase [Alphaproteobacteria bacterium]